MVLVSATAALSSILPSHGAAQRHRQVPLWQPCHGSVAVVGAQGVVEAAGTVDTWPACVPSCFVAKVGP